MCIFLQEKVTEGHHDRVAVSSLHLQKANVRHVSYRQHIVHNAMSEKYTGLNIYTIESIMS
jgi:hypothetical protein